MSRVLTLPLCAAALVVVALLVSGTATPQDQQEEFDPVLPPGRIWTKTITKTVKKYEFLELRGPDDRWLVLNRLELIVATHSRAQLVERRLGKHRMWKTTVRRPEQLMLGTAGTFAGTNRTILGYSSLLGLAFEPEVRIGVMMTQGSGEITVHAEGYWAKP